MAPSVEAISVIGAVFVTAALFASPPAVADPADDPCGLAVTFLCRFIPAAPDLDHDLDLTDQQPSADPSAPEPDSRPPADICTAGCV